MVAGQPRILLASPIPRIPPASRRADSAASENYAKMLSAPSLRLPILPIPLFLRISRDRNSVKTVKSAKAVKSVMGCPACPHVSRMSPNSRHPQLATTVKPLKSIGAVTGCPARSHFSHTSPRKRDQNSVTTVKSAQSVTSAIGRPALLRMTRFPLNSGRLTLAQSVKGVRALDKPSRSFGAFRFPPIFGRTDSAKSKTAVRMAGSLSRIFFRRRRIRESLRKCATWIRRHVRNARKR